MNKNVAVVAVHPDDETLGCGGTLLKYMELGYSLSWIIVTGMKEEYGWAKERIASRAQEIDTVKAMYRFGSVYELNFKPAGLDEYPLGEIVGAISKVFTEIQPSIVFLPNPTDAHSDHSVAFNAAFSCTKKFRYPSINTILTMEVLSETDHGYPSSDFKPNFFINISEQFKKKIDAMKVYESEFKKHPFPRSERTLEALALLRGAQAGCEYAEAFHLIKHVEE